MRIEVTVTDEDGVELSVDPASTTTRAFAVRAEAFTRTLNPFGSNTPVQVGVSSPVARAKFLADSAERRRAEADAVLDLMQQLRPRSLEVLIP